MSNQAETCTAPASHLIERLMGGKTAVEIDKLTQQLAEARSENERLKGIKWVQTESYEAVAAVKEARQEAAREIVDMLFDTEFEGPNKAKFEKVVAVFISHIKSKFKLEG